MHMLHMHISIMFIMAVAFAFTMCSPFLGFLPIISPVCFLVKTLSRCSGKAVADLTMLCYTNQI